MKKVPKAAERNDKANLDQGLEKELKQVNSVLNRFLKLYFTIEIDSLQEYLHRVKDLLINLTTKPASAVLTNIFSKFSNILQPFTSYSYDLSLDTLKIQIAHLREENVKLKRKTEKMGRQLQQYRVKSARSMEFIYMLRTNNINVDELFRKGLGKTRPQIPQEQEVETRIGRAPVEVTREQLLQNISQQSNLTSQYVSVKSKR